MKNMSHVCWNMIWSCTRIVYETTLEERWTDTLILKTLFILLIRTQIELWVIQFDSTIYHHWCPHVSFPSSAFSCFPILRGIRLIISIKTLHRIALVSHNHVSNALLGWLHDFKKDIVSLHFTVRIGFNNPHGEH